MKTTKATIRVRTAMRIKNNAVAAAQPGTLNDFAEKALIVRVGATLEDLVFLMVRADLHGLPEETIDNGEDYVRSLTDHGWEGQAVIELADSIELDRTSSDDSEEGRDGWWTDLEEAYAAEWERQCDEWFAL